MPPIKNYNIINSNYNEINDIKDSKELSTFINEFGIEDDDQKIDLAIAIRQKPRIFDNIPIKPLGFQPPFVQIKKLENNIPNNKIQPLACYGAFCLKLEQFFNC